MLDLSTLKGKQSERFFNLQKKYMSERGTYLSRFLKEMSKSTPNEKAFDAGSLWTSIALFILSIPGAVGVFAGSTMGGAAIVLGGAGFGLHLAVGKLEERKINFLTGIWRTLTPILLGSLGVIGALSGAQVAWGVMGVFLVLFGWYVSMKFIPYETPLETT